MQLAIVVLAYVPSHTLRKAGMRLAGTRIGSKTLVYRGLYTLAPWRLTIGRSSVVGDHAILDARGGLVIGDNVNLSANVAIWTGQHDYQSPMFAYETAPVQIGDYAWLSFRTTILPGVRVGEGAVVAAGAVVTKDVPPYAIVAGIPAKVIGTRNRDLRYNLLDDSNYLHFV
jgi:acetyltransferase-like isoleucine patch superfamily enzyme